MKQLRITTIVVALLGTLFVISGCNADENPITPDKMEEIRKQEGEQRGNFNPNMSRPAEGG
ncbi:MAG TPA: hypothetical protein VM328_04020 [Fimbriimonadaceae bacterium]|nr:hypothetical protein [Fimbriimonadaceae bacterium]